MKFNIKVHGETIEVDPKEWDVCEIIEQYCPDSKYLLLKKEIGGAFDITRAIKVRIDQDPELYETAKKIVFNYNIRKVYNERS